MNTLLVLGLVVASCLADDNSTKKDYYIGKYLEDDVSDGIKGNFKGDNVRDVSDGIDEDVEGDNVRDVSDGIEEDVEEGLGRNVRGGLGGDVKGDLHGGIGGGREIGFRIQGGPDRLGPIFLSLVTKVKKVIRIPGGPGPNFPPLITEVTEIIEASDMDKHTLKH